MSGGTSVSSMRPIELTVVVSPLIAVPIALVLW
jgi:hypothetical protein